MTARTDRTLQAVIALTVLALVLRLVAVGARGTHWDEARVAYWILEYHETGVLFYRPIIHGPLIHLVNAPLIGLLGPTDTVIRLVPVLVGSALPLAALLFRHRLTTASTIALAGFLAVNPVLLYYSRFMRSDILVGAFCFVAFGCLIRAIDFDDPRYLFPTALLLGLGFGAKENTIAYLVAWLGAAILLLHHRLLFARFTPESPTTVLARYATWTASGLKRYISAIAASGGLFVLTIIVVYAPRGAVPSQSLYYRSCLSYDGYFTVANAPTLGEAIANPLLLPRLAVFTLGSTAELYSCQWITPRTDDPNPYLEFLGDLLLITVESSAVIAVLAAAGFIATLYSDATPDDLVSFAFYWGIASLIGYPFIMDIGGSAWLVVHVILPLAIPAAYAAGILTRWAREAHDADDRIGLGLILLIGIVLIGSMAGTGYATTYADPKADTNPLVQYAQPAGDVEPTIRDMETLAAQTEGTDVILYGEHFHNPTGQEELERRPTCANWFNALPLPWYFEAHDMTVECAPTAADLETALAGDPPVVIAHADDRAAVDQRIDDRYTQRIHLMRNTDTPFIYYLDDTQL